MSPLDMATRKLLGLHNLERGDVNFEAQARIRQHLYIRVITIERFSPKTEIADRIRQCMNRGYFRCRYEGWLVLWESQ